MSPAKAAKKKSAAKKAAPRPAPRKSAPKPAAKKAAPVKVAAKSASRPAKAGEEVIYTDVRREMRSRLLGRLLGV